MKSPSSPADAAVAPQAPRSPAAGVRAGVAAIERADVALGVGLARRGGDGTPLMRAAAKAGKLGDQEPLYALGAAALVAGLAARRGRLAATGLAVLAAVAAADGGKTLAKRLVHRTRPNVLLGRGRYAAGAGGSRAKPEQSFPSGHVAGSLAAALAVSRRFPAAGAIACGAAAAVGVGRVVRAAHWPLDVLAGAVIGVAAEAATSGLLRGLGAIVTLFMNPDQTWRGAVDISAPPRHGDPMVKRKAKKPPATGKAAPPDPKKAILAAAQPGKLPPQRRVIDLGGIGR